MNKQKVISSFAFKFIERLAVKGIGLVISIVLARLLTPELFGSLAIIMVFVNLAQTFVQSGMGTALVQNRETKEDDYSTVFYLSLGIALALILLLFAAAPFIAQYYKDDSLTWPLRVFSFSLVFGALNSVQTARLQREMQFRTMMSCNLIATVISGIMGISAAFLGAGLWALVIYSVSQTIAVCVCMMIAQKWYPKLVFSVKRAKVLFSFGWKMLVSSLLCSLYYDVRALIIGRRYSAADLGYYNKAQQYPDLVSKTINDSVQAVMLPAMATIQDNKEALNSILLKTISSTMFGEAPAMLGFAVVAETLIPLLLTEKWVACVPFLVIFCLGNLVGTFSTANLSLLKATGRADVYMQTEAIRRVVMIATLLITVFVFDSVMAIAVGYALGLWLDAWIIMQATKKLTGIGCIKQITAVWKPVFAAVIMAAVVYPMNMIPCGDLLRLLLQITAGVVVYLLVSILVKNESLLMVKSMLMKKSRKVGY